jgi:hypothetical protein
MPPAPLFRERNALVEQLRGSLCVFRLHAPRDVAPESLCPAALREACARIDADLDVERRADATTLTLSVSHATLDAFGGMYLLARSGAVSVARACAPDRTALAGTFSYWHSVRLRDEGDAARTHTQRTVEAMLDVLGPAAGERVALIVSKDDPARIDERSFLGNSLVLLEMPRGELAELARAPKGAWRQAIMQQSDRVRAIAEKRAALLRTTAARLTFSSVGDVRRIPWASELDPSFFEMVPTPSTCDGATVVLWGRGTQQALTVCADRDGLIARAHVAIRDAWEGALR